LHVVIITAMTKVFGEYINKDANESSRTELSW
jgi:hypothetical protein